MRSARWQIQDGNASKTHAFEGDDERGFDIARDAAVCGTQAPDREKLSIVVEAPGTSDVNCLRCKSVLDGLNAKRMKK